MLALVPAASLSWLPPHDPSLLGPVADSGRGDAELEVRNASDVSLARWAGGLAFARGWAPSNADNCELVLAEYDEVAGVEEAINARLCSRIYVYSKSRSCAAIAGSSFVQRAQPSVAVACEELPNVGREQHSFLYHVARHYDQLATHVLFSALPIERKHPERMSVLRTGLALLEGGIVRDGRPLNSSFFSLFQTVTPSTTSALAPARPAASDSQRTRRFLAANRPSRGDDGGTAALGLNSVFARAARMGYPSGWCDPETGGRCLDYTIRDYHGAAAHPADVEPLWAWEQRHAGLGREALLHVPICFKGTATTTRSNLHARPQRVYAALRDATADADETEAGHFGERLMAANFGPPSALWMPGP